MGMTIDEAKDILTSENFAGHSISEILEARDITLDIMHKYQKIQEIINNTDYIQEDVIRYKMICGVVKDGID